MNRDSLAPSGRRSFFTRLNAGLAALAGVGGIAMAQSKQTAARWEPARHDKDDWLDKPSTRHRLLFDTTSSEGVGNALAFADNFYRVNKNEYGVENSELAVVIVLRHRSAAFGYSEAMWKKYGTTLGERSKVEDPKTHAAPVVNLYNASGYGELIPNRGITFESLSKLGAQFAVCTLSTRANAGLIARAVGSTPAAILEELTSNLVSNGRMVPAGIVAVGRAQERGFSLVTC